MQRCHKCGIEKEESDFYIFKPNKSGLHYDCKTCMKLAKKNWDAKNKGMYYIKHKERFGNYRRMKLYGITVDEYEELKQRQDGRCAICGRTQEQSGKSLRELCIDHDHKTGRVRGLLCTRCNTMIAGIEHEDDIFDTLKRVKDYLER